MTPRAERRRPSVVAFDVVGTFFSLEPLRPQLKEAGFLGTALDEWFSRFLHTGAIVGGVTGQAAGDARVVSWERRAA